MVSARRVGGEEGDALGDVLDLANPRRVVRAVEVLRLTGATPTQRAGATPDLVGYRPTLYQVHERSASLKARGGIKTSVEVVKRRRAT